MLMATSDLVNLEPFAVQDCIDRLRQLAVALNTRTFEDLTNVLQTTALLTKSVG